MHDQVRQTYFLSSGMTSGLFPSCEHNGQPTTIEGVTRDGQNKWYTQVYSYLFCESKSKYGHHAYSAGHDSMELK